MLIADDVYFSSFSDPIEPWLRLLSDSSHQRNLSGERFLRWSELGDVDFTQYPIDYCLIEIVASKVTISGIGDDLQRLTPSYFHGTAASTDALP